MASLSTADSYPPNTAYAMGSEKFLKQCCLFYDKVFVLQIEPDFAEDKADIQFILTPLWSTADYRNLFSKDGLISLCQEIASERHFTGKLDNRCTTALGSNPHWISNMHFIFERSVVLTDSTRTCPVASLVGLQMPDVTNASWQQIVEIRSDAESSRKIRDLRYFLHHTSDDISQDEFTDRLGQLLDLQRSAMAKHGVDITHGILGQLLNATSLQRAGFLSMASVMLNQPVGLLLAALSQGRGALVEIGNIVLQLSQERTDFARECKDNPLTYILEIEEHVI